MRAGCPTDPGGPASSAARSTPWLWPGSGCRPRQLDLTDLHFICNNDSSSNEELSLVKAGSSETVELPRSSVYSIHVSGKAANGTSFSNTFSGTIDNSSSVTISLDDSANLSMIANIAD